MTMEALNFLRFWKQSSYGAAHKDNPNQPCFGNREIPKSNLKVVSDHQELDEGEDQDSFIDLELPLHDDFNKDQRKGNVSSSNNNDHFSKRKIIPIEPPSSNSKPQSPIALLKSSAPKFRVFTLNKSKSMANNTAHKTEKTEFIDISTETPKHEKQHSKVKFRIQESPSPVFTRKNSLRKTEDDSSSKRLMQKYLNVIKPLYVKAGSKSDKARVSGDLSMSPPASSPPAATAVHYMKGKQGNVSTEVRNRGGCKQLGKSRSASAAAAAASPISRRDDSLLLQHDGIQSAILHCKKSFNSSRAESSWLSRCTSDSSQEKLSNASSTDSSLLSRVTSNSSYEKLMDSARISSEDGNVLSTLKY